LLFSEHIKCILTDKYTSLDFGSISKDNESAFFITIKKGKGYAKNCEGKKEK
jgi:hypothetical protein